MHGVGWFLVCMFWCYLIYYGIHRIAEGRMSVKLSISMIVPIFFYYMSTWRSDMLGGHRLVLPFFLSTSFTCMALISIGELLKKYLLLDKRYSCKMLIISILFGVICILIWGCKGGAMIVNDYYGQSYFIWLANSILGSISILEICKYLPSFMTFFGKHSLLMLMAHPYVKRILLLFSDLTVISLIIIIAITSFLVYILAKYLPITEGKLKNYGIN